MAEKRPRAARTWTQFEAKSKFYDYVSMPKYWFYQSDPGVKHNNKQCKTCIYRSNHHDSNADRIHCDYLGIMGHMRGCHSSPTCTKYVKGKRLRTKQHFNPHHKAGFSNTIDEPPYVRLKSFSK